MRIAVGADHAGYELKEHLATALREGGHSVDDFGTSGLQSVDYPDFAAAVGRAVAEGAADRGILICGSGIGMAIAANKIHGVRAANCNDLFMAQLCRRHNDANVLTLGARVIGTSYADAVVRAFLETPYEGDRHQRRLGKITSLES
ncbi:MAG: ribose 5-phosphate isomerase B [Thermoanaerobaculia bacterium]|nr:ribose 5-phosphate isomerase B [Thermoanaerobaculia bacterium]